MKNMANRLPGGIYLDPVAALQRVGDSSSLRDMLGMLADLLALDIPRIEQSLLSGDLSEAANRLHSLKGCLPIFCHPEICDAVARAEHAAKRASITDLTAIYAELRPQLQALGEEVQVALVLQPSQAQL